MLPRKRVRLLLLEHFLEVPSLLDAISVQLVLNDLFLQHFVAELKLVDTVNEVFSRNIPASTFGAGAEY